MTEEGEPRAGGTRGEPGVGVMLERLREVYAMQNKAREFADEQPVYHDLVPKLVDDLRPFELREPKALGSTASVWVVFDPKLEQQRALKLPRPRLGKLKDIIRIVRSEQRRLATLNHQNIIKIYGGGEVDLRVGGEDYKFPYFVMEFLEDIHDIDDYIVDRHRDLVAEDIIGYFRDLLSGLAVLHSKGIIHCDIKPGNMLLAPNKPALIADLGYAKHLSRVFEPVGRSKFTEVRYTPPYAHPELQNHMIESSDSAANIAEIPRDKLHRRFDLFAFGRTMQEILYKLREAEKNDPSKQNEHRSVFSRYQWLYLGFIAKRLLDGVIERTHEDDLKSDVIPGLPPSVMKELRYNSAEDAIDDLEKILHLYDLEGTVPELNPNISSFIQIPHCRVPLTQRVKDVINHPTFGRLAQVTQLGFVSLVYPGASHSRLEHVLGTFAHCCDYVRALWYDQANCLFQCIMSKEDIEAVLLSALLHDVGQYPMAHDLAETAREFVHESFTAQVLERVDPTTGESLRQVVHGAWGINITRILSIMSASENSTFRDRLLHSIIDGPMDCDKLDYLRRDSTHLGVSFGLAIDHDRMLRNLTIVYHSSASSGDVDGSVAKQPTLEVAEIGVTEKAYVVAQTLWRVRKDMFTQVYWQHTARAIRAMLAYVVRAVILELHSEESKIEFWSRFTEYVTGPAWLGGFRSRPFAFGGRGGSPDKNSQPSSGHEGTETIDLQQLGLDGDARSNNEAVSFSHLSPTDDSLLEFLSAFAPPPALAVVTAIRERKLYTRLAVLSGAVDPDRYSNIYNAYTAYLLRTPSADFQTIEKDREGWEHRIVDESTKRLVENPGLLPDGQTIEDIKEGLETERPLILVDIPVKATSKKQLHEEQFLWYLPEDRVGVHSRPLGSFPRFIRSRLDIAEAGFDKDVGKIRVFAHPRWATFLTKAIDDRQIWEIVSS